MIWLNENNPYAAQWLRNLIAKGHLPNGRVDDRSILAVPLDDVPIGGQCHFFAGIGGWPYALELAGWPAEREVWTASLPCQPLSVAGQRRGALDERHLWPAFHRLVAERRPATIFGEQVASADGREWLAAVRHDLEGDGYAVGTACLPACSVGAPHRRYRLFWLAHAQGERSGGDARELSRPRLTQSESRPAVESGILGDMRAAGFVADAESDGRQGRSLTKRRRTADRNSAGRQFIWPGWPTPLEDDANNGTRATGNYQSLTRTALGTAPIGSGAETKNTGQLNPAHSRWLMGYPVAWDDCAPTATPSSRKSPPNSSEPTLT